MGLDPVAVKLVTSLNRPEGNVTGITSLNVEVGPKRLELLHELLPSVIKIAVLVNPTNQLNTETTIKDLHDPARARGLELHLLNASTERDFETAFAGLVQLQAGALIVAGDIFFHSRPQQLAALSLKYAVPAVMAVREFAVAGGLISYGGDVGNHTGKPVPTPVASSRARSRRTSPFDKLRSSNWLSISRTAKALGITVSCLYLGRADEVIE